MRYAKEIPNLESILSNDIDEAAVESIKRNAVFNGVDHVIVPNRGDATYADAHHTPRHHLLTFVCSMVMMEHRSIASRFDVVDIDPYGSPSQFLDSAVQCIEDGGMGSQQKKLKLKLF